MTVNLDSVPWTNARHKIVTGWGASFEATERSARIRMPFKLRVRSKGWAREPQADIRFSHAVDKPPEVRFVHRE